MQPTNILQILLEHWWSIPVGIFCLTISIFVHELGHFLAARWRGVWVPRFSFFGLGKPIFGWKWRGVEWCVCWIPIGAHVLIPQLADLGDAEGGSVDVPPEKMAPLTYFDKVVISVAGAAFNLIFAFLVGSVLWFAGEKVSAGSQSTTIGHVLETIRTADGKTIPGPAKVAGLQPGDVIRAIDGTRTTTWDDVVQGLVLGDGMLAGGRRTAEFTVERDGRELVISVNPELATVEKIRRVGITSANGVTIAKLDPEKTLAKLGRLQPDDRLIEVDGAKYWSGVQLEEAFARNETAPVRLKFSRGNAVIPVELPPKTAGKDGAELGLLLKYDTVTIHVPPHTQIANQVRNSLRLIRSLFSPSSDIGLSKMSGPIGILTVFAAASLAGVLAVLSMILTVNVSFAVLNLLPIPVLDGGHVLFATYQKLAGRPLPPSFVRGAQATFFFALIGLMLYVAPHDVMRATRPLDETPPAATKPAPTEPPRTEPTPAKP